MNKENLIKIAEQLYQEAFNANAYYIIMDQYKCFLKKYNTEMKVSPAFYQTIQSALLEACFIENAKLYDASKEAITVGSLLQECQNNITLFPEYRATITIDHNGRKYSFPIPYSHYLKPEEECFFKNQVESQRKIFEILYIPSPEPSPIQVDLTFREFLDLYQKRFRALSKKRENLREQRNKIYVHNDKEEINDINDILKNNPISFSDIKELIDFALDCIGFIIGVLTDVSRARQYVNIKDWERTLMLVRSGLKHQGYDM